VIRGGMTNLSVGIVELKTYYLLYLDK